jgi:methyl-accepting chemotaxis protein
MNILDRGANAVAVLAALSKSQAMIEFDLSGNILTANESFCRALGYELREIVGKHHSMFVEPAYASSAEYKAFWTKLSAGKFDQQQYNGSERAGVRSGSKHPTIPCSDAGSRSRSSRLQPISPRRS